MKRATFPYWLMKQLNRDDSIGDLARDVRSDEDFPQLGTPAEMIAYLEFLCAIDGAKSALKTAWFEYLEWSFRLSDSEISSIEYRELVSLNVPKIAEAYQARQSRMP